MILESFVEIPNKYFDSRIIDIGCGNDHTLFLSSNGRVFSCGADNLLQLGLGWTKTKCIQSNSNWTQLGREGYIAHCNAFNNLNISAAAMDNNKKNEYFFELPPTDEFYPRVITGPYFDDYKVIDIDCGDYHSAIIIEPLDFVNPLLRQRNRVKFIENSINDNIEFSNKSKETINNEFSFNDNNDEIIDFQQSQLDSIRNELNSINKCDLSDLRRVITWGCGLKGQLGLANLKNASEPKAITSLEDYREYSDNMNEYIRIRPCEIACGIAHTIVLLQGKDNESAPMIFGFGSNNHKQAAPKKKSKKITKPQWIQQILPDKFNVSHITAGCYQSAAFA